MKKICCIIFIITVIISFILFSILFDEVIELHHLQISEAIQWIKNLDLLS